MGEACSNACAGSRTYRHPPSTRRPSAR
jgi:hypothetical protein